MVSSLSFLDWDLNPGMDENQEDINFLMNVFENKSSAPRRK